MDYLAVNLPSPGQPAPAPFQSTLGTYDYWAIEYAYKPIPPSEEAAELARIASRSTDPLLAYADDADAGGVAGNDGLTYAAGQRVLLAKQTTTTQDGIYVVGTVGGGTAPLTRAADMAAASVQPAGMEVKVNEGTLFGSTTWFSTLAGANTVATSSPAFYPRKYVRVTTAMAGTPGVKALSAEWILSASKSSVTPTVITPGTQGFLSRGTLTPGAGDGSFTITSTANETSTLSIVIEN